MRISISKKTILCLLFLGALLAFCFFLKETISFRKTVSRTNTDSTATPFQSFKNGSVIPDAFLKGEGRNIDSPEFFEDGEKTLLLVSAKSNDLIEIWPYPFTGVSSTSLKRDSSPNGLAIDQDENLLLVGDIDGEYIDIFSLPALERLRQIGDEALRSGETNMDVLTLPNGKKFVYGTESKEIHGFDLESGERKYSFNPSVESVEEIVADSYYQVLYVPEEKGAASDEYKGGAITAYTPEGKPFEKDGTSVLGEGVFQEDGEGITLYMCRDESGNDTGRGFIIASDQRRKLNDFEFFDRQTWEHLGSLQVEGVSYTDGITATSRPLPLYPKGIFAAVNNDTDTAIVSWQKIEDATGLRCQ